MTREEHRKKRHKRAKAGNGTSNTAMVSIEDTKFSLLLAREQHVAQNEDDLLQLVKVNKVVQKILASSSGKAKRCHEDTKQRFDGFQVVMLCHRLWNGGKVYLKARRSETKRSFIRDERAAMITNVEIDNILHRSFERIVGLLEFSWSVLVSTHTPLVPWFQDDAHKGLMQQLTDANCETLAQPDSRISDRFKVFDDTHIKGLKISLSNGT